jgi:hypothetical protein
LGKTAVTFVTGSSLNGRILAQTAVAVQMATINHPDNAAIVPPPPSPTEAPTAAPQPAPETSIALGDAAGFAIISGTAVGNTGSSVITGNVAVNGAAAAITGFDLTYVAGGASSTSNHVVGNVYAVGYSSTMASDAVNDMNDAYNYAAGRQTTRGGQVAAIVLGTTFAGANDPFLPGVYTYGAAVTNVGDIYFDGQGHQNSVFIIQITGAFALATVTKVQLVNGAQSKNIFWQITGAASFAASAQMKGTILSTGAIALAAGSHLEGRALAKTAVTLGLGATISLPPS